ncbi:MAG: hypothetical protein SCH98_07575, partial [Deferrisomatales bacterium]|nr:hypothetical protein [Deferrisomatales bacterium]
MPLAFPSLSHGTVAFGFYNVETDGLLLDRLFFFCTDFCRAAVELAAGGPEGASSSLRGFALAGPEEIGDLMGAIRGVRHVGFLGDVYRLWPFPADPAGFRQKPDGAHNRRFVEELLQARAPEVEIGLVAE